MIWDFSESGLLGIRRGTNAVDGCFTRDSREALALTLHQDSRVMQTEANQKWGFNFTLPNTRHLAECYCTSRSLQVRRRCTSPYNPRRWGRRLRTPNRLCFSAGWISAFLGWGKKKPGAFPPPTSSILPRNPLSEKWLGLVNRLTWPEDHLVRSLKLLSLALHSLIY